MESFLFILRQQSRGEEDVEVELLHKVRVQTQEDMGRGCSSPIRNFEAEELHELCLLNPRMRSTGVCIGVQSPSLARGMAVSILLSPENSVL